MVFYSAARALRMTRLHDLPAHERPRERLSSLGAGALSEAELIALLLGTGTKKENAVALAHSLLSQQDLQKLSRSSLSELRIIPGVGEAKASRLVAAFELGRRAGSRPAEVRQRLGGPEEVVKLFGERLAGLRYEQLLGLYLDTRGRLLASRVLAQGALNAALVQPREVFAPALSEGAAALVLVHNHPSGDPEPSEADVEFTKLVAAAGELFGIPLLDHLILAGREWRSLRRLGVLKKG